MRRVSRIVPWVIGLALSVDAGPTQGQWNIDARKSPEQIFSETCGACHHTPQELKQTSAQFLRKHYTTGAQQAAAMAAYLEMAINELPAAAVAPLRPPHRPSESVEMKLPAAGSAADPGGASLPRAAAAIQTTDDGFEE